MEADIEKAKVELKDRICKTCGFILPHDRDGCVDNLKDTLDKSALSIIDGVTREYKLRRALSLCKAIMLALSRNEINEVGGCPLTISDGLKTVKETESEVGDVGTWVLVPES